MSKQVAAQTYLDILCATQDPIYALRNLETDPNLTQSDIPEIERRVSAASESLTRAADQLLSTNQPWPTNLQNLVATLAAEEVVRADEYEALLGLESIGDFESRYAAMISRLTAQDSTTSRDIRRELGLPDRGGCPGTIVTTGLFLERVRNVAPNLETINNADLVEEAEAWCEFVSVQRTQADVGDYIPQSRVPVDSFAEFAVSAAATLCPEYLLNVSE